MCCYALLVCYSIVVIRIVFLCLCSWLAIMCFSFSVASAIFQTGSVSGGLFGCKMAASMD